MKLGINQLPILRRCYHKGFIGIVDVSVYYNIRCNSKNKDYLLAVLEKLEIRGLLVRDSEYNWKLSDFGKDLVEKHFNFKPEKRG